MAKKITSFWEWVLLLMAVLLLVSSYFVSYRFTNDHQLSKSATKIEAYIQDQKRQFEAVLKDDTLITKLLQSKMSLKDIVDLYQKPFSFFLYKDQGNSRVLQFWNTAQVLPDQNTISGADGAYFVQLPNGYYYVLKQKLPAHPNYTAYCLILIKHSFFIETSRLVNGFPFDENLHKIADISFAPKRYPVTVDAGKPLFYLTEKANATPFSNSIAVVLLRISGLFLFFTGLYLLLCKLYVKKNHLLDILLFTSCMLAFRIILFIWSSFFHLQDVALFDPAIYASNFLLPSLGDLLINSLLFCWTTIFIWNRLSVNTLRFFEKLSPAKRQAIALIGLLVIVASTFLLSIIISSIISDSKISFDVMNPSGLNAYTAIGFLVLACLCLGFYYLSRIAFKYIFLVFNRKSFMVYIWLIAMCLLYIIFFGKTAVKSFYIPVSIWLLLYTILFHEEQAINRLVKFTMSGIVFWIFFFSVSLAVLTLNEIKKTEIAERKLFVEKLATQIDPSSERLISIANKYLDSNFFEQNFARLQDVRQNKIIRDSIVSKNYVGYLNKYITAIYIFDGAGNPLYNPDRLSLESLNTLINRQAKPTSVSELYYYETDFDKFAYIHRRIIKNSKDSTLGTAFIVSNPKKFAGATIHPELFKEFNRWDITNSSVYQFAIYNKNILINSSKKYPFTTTLTAAQIPHFRYELREQNGYDELWYRVSADKIVVMVRHNETVMEAITLFSYLFCSFLFLVALIHIISMLVASVTKGRFLGRQFLFFPTIRGQIHATFILITVLSFFIVAIATISFFIKRYENNNRERLSRTMSIMLNELQNHNELLNTIYNLSGGADTTHIATLDNLVKLVSDIHGVDVNLYDLTGKLRSTSQPDVYSKGVLSTQIGPRAYHSLRRLRRVEHVQDEWISNLHFTSIYSPIRNKEGQVYGYVGIPYFTSQEQLNQEISSFLVTIINLNAFIFLVTGLVALLIANRITRSFSLISDKMKKISLSQNNEEIVWERNDEIGALLSEYNKMAVKLKKSADTIAKDEREGAWREMAKQVAHEIKNPLTPMKLSLQYLQKAINENSPNAPLLTANVSKNLVEQIDHLSKIAADFYQFANINQASKQLFDLHDVLQPLQELYSKNANIQFTWLPLSEPIYILADKTQMNRLFTNLLVNAIDATSGTEMSAIVIKEQLEKDSVVVSITDNGEGIPDSMRSKIFMPNFTTKSSGTGLGLAMCKGIVERMSGHIWFDTQPGMGTTFYVQLPLAAS